MKIDEDSDVSMERDNEHRRQVEDIEKKVRLKHSRPQTLNNNYVEYKKGKKMSQD